MEENQDNYYHHHHHRKSEKTKQGDPEIHKQGSTPPTRVILILYASL